MSKHRATLRSVTGTLGAVALSVSLVACGDSDEGHGDEHASEKQTASNGDVFNAADVDFATGMIPHHAQAIEMTVIARDRPLDPEAQSLVEQIREAQTPEVELMTDWLTAWNQEVPETSIDHANADHGDMEGTEDDSDMHGDEMPGMMNEEELEELDNSSDAGFQDLWLEMMIEHHEGAIEMAQAEQEDGEFADAIELAESIEVSQSAEIDTMERLLG